MGYTINAALKNPKSEKTPDEIELVSFGIYDTEILNYKDSKTNSSALENIRNKFNGMMAKTPKQPKPLTFSWFPLKEKTSIFTGFRGKKLDLRLAVVDNDNKFRWEWAFEGLELNVPRHEIRVFPGNFRRQDERYDAVFIKFKDKW